MCPWFIRLKGKRSEAFEAYLLPRKYSRCLNVKLEKRGLPQNPKWEKTDEPCQKISDHCLSF